MIAASAKVASAAWTALLLAAVFAVALASLTDRDLRAVTSSSMEPSVPVGSLVLLEPAPPGSVGVGDVVAFDRAGEAGAEVLHRVVGVNETGHGRFLTTQGDHNATPDPVPVHETAVEGRLVAGIPRLGRATLALSEPRGLVVLVGVPLALAVAQWIGSRRRSAGEHADAEQGQVVGGGAALELGDGLLDGAHDGADVHASAPPDDRLEAIEAERLAVR